ncbi:MAG: glycosyltransferase family 2 protein [Ignavibacteriales bacterium CG_4_9_14_3_um_filter_30_11]|nr:MAG: glycosyltransferase family 2 protein [Ignavibacteriales bacterium CG_4_9_14_3_um_filter_30_11]
MKIPNVYIIVLNYNNPNETILCLNSLLKVDYPTLNIVIADNASTDSSVEQIKKQFPSLFLLQNKYNKGYAGGMNLGIKYALENNADLILLSNNDMIYPADFLLPLVKALTNEKAVGIVSPKVLYLNDKEKIYCAGGEIKLFRCGGVSMYRNRDEKKYGNKKRDITLAEGACLLVKKVVFVEKGLLSEKYFMYFEDVEFSERISSKFKIKYIPESVVYHKSGAGKTWSEYSPLYYYYFTRNRLLYYSTKNFLINIYVIFFSILNTLSKSILLGIKISTRELGYKNFKKSFSNLWKGLIDGLLYTVKIKKITNDNPILKNKLIQ